MRSCDRRVTEGDQGRDAPVSGFTTDPGGWAPPPSQLVPASPKAEPTGRQECGPVLVPRAPTPSFLEPKRPERSLGEPRQPDEATTFLKQWKSPNCP